MFNSKNIRTSKKEPSNPNLASLPSSYENGSVESYSMNFPTPIKDIIYDLPDWLSTADQNFIGQALRNGFLDFIAN